MPIVTAKKIGGGIMETINTEASPEIALPTADAPPKLYDK
jgi:hypothetical protein